MEKTMILGIGFNTQSKERILEYIITSLEKSSEKTFVVTPNPELIMLASRDSHYASVLNSAQISLPDGVGVVWAAKMLGEEIKARIAGIDFMKSLCEKVSKKPVTVGLFGASPGVAERAAECLRENYPGLNVVYASSEWDEKSVVNANIDILFVALGSPKQELWIAEHLARLPVKVVMGVGGAFDMISGKVTRAPVFVQRLGLEWLWRLIRQPWRAKRQLQLLIFITAVLREKVR